ncbi:MAG: 1,4-dihydroxy-2-naphthoate octaprenyltransferase [Candidatus Omnitrophica bacterium CG1_02_44_16]|nr:MAG: 1,4-dihydroxy-2-naphthoate octaprenyltransferase [Candidatus Omnitrophica bacterium CG1_02_44_16]PIY82235.1 MAG: 1,4-dihydroxy-2-naphthoate octaprenyltransferase [Candidatus Omnitrophica bacterium CG_4_10_14_0_8_um_filter_44_12]PIZ83635.1 MAG: 1,4-dihydroxy-2-naphthoate octaprenyltransferase [Candidatus Omnitrophica bacterium CG_4_10_14_0_2_um_filter_44_9]
MNMGIKVWLKAVRAPFLTATIIPVLMGYLLAWHDTSTFVWQLFLLALSGAIFIHIGTNLANDFFDHLMGCDEANLTPTPFSGGSRVIQDGLISPKKILCVSLTFFILGAIIGFYLNYVSGKNVILVLGAIGIFLAFFYSARPFKIGYKCFGEVSTGLGFGPIMAMGAYFVGARQLSFKVFLVSIPVGILIALVLFINEFPDHDGDKAVGKRTLVVFLGKKNAVILYQALLVALYVIIIALVVVKFLPYLCLFSLLTLPVAFKAFMASGYNYEKIYELLPVNAATISLHSIIGSLLCAGIAVDKFLILRR